jgi:hypothetical protein
MLEVLSVASVSVCQKPTPLIRVRATSFHECLVCYDTYFIGTVIWQKKKYFFVPQCCSRALQPRSVETEVPVVRPAVTRFFRHVCLLSSYFSGMEGEGGKFRDY